MIGNAELCLAMCSGYGDEDWQEGSVDKGICCQAWGPQFDPHSPCGGRREPAPKSCLLTSTQAQWHKHAFTLTQKYFFFISMKSQCWVLQCWDYSRNFWDVKNGLTGFRHHIIRLVFWRLRFFLCSQMMSFSSFLIYVPQIYNLGKARRVCQFL